MGASSWAAEWCGRNLGVWLLSHVGCAVGCVAGVLADVISAVYGRDGGSPSQCGLPDCLKVRSGLLIADVDDVLQACYDSHPTRAYPVLDHSLSAAWYLCVERAMVSNRALAAVHWLSVAPCCHIR